MRKLQLNAAPRSKVELIGGWAYKRQPMTLCDNAEWCYKKLSASGYVPKCERVDIETIRTVYVESEPVTDKEAFMAHYEPVLQALKDAGIRHGDLTPQSVLVKDNRPILIDFAESRLWNDPRPDKRPEGDAFWLKHTMEILCER